MNKLSKTELNISDLARGKGGKAPAVVIIPDEPREELLSGSGAVSAISQCVCEAGAKIAGRPLYRHLALQRLGGEVGMHRYDIK